MLVLGFGFLISVGRTFVLDALLGAAVAVVPLVLLVRTARVDPRGRSGIMIRQLVWLLVSLLAGYLPMFGGGV